MNPEYIEFVESRAKPGEAILETLTPEKVHLLHMAIGISGEAAEFLQAYGAEDGENIQEELGDLLFYAVGATLVLPWSPSQFARAFQICPFEHMGYVNAIVVASGNFLDIVKKYVVYNKPISDADLMDSLTIVMAAVIDYCENYEINPHTLVKENMAKLTKRYATGYSDQAAQARADKEVSGD